jgi:hypothetical protein
VLAKILGGRPGTKGISLFIVPKCRQCRRLRRCRNDVALAGLNHKMGQRAYQHRAELVREFSPGGKPGAVAIWWASLTVGWAYMFTMMNEARLVGMGAVSLGYTGYLKSLEWRANGRKVVRSGQGPVSSAGAINEHADVKRMLLGRRPMSKADGAAAGCAKLVDLQRSASPMRKGLDCPLLDILTSVGKSWPSQWCLEANDLAIQVHGGYGYTREYDVEQHYRDNRLNPIHEGTHGIQSLDLLGRKVTQRGGASLAALGDAVAATIATANAAGGETAEHAAQLDSTWQRLVSVTTAMFGSGDAEAALANSVVYLEAFGHIVVAWMWLEQLLAANGRSGDFYDGERQAARYFFRYELPKTAPQLDLLASLDRTTLEMRDSWF